MKTKAPETLTKLLASYPEDARFFRTSQPKSDGGKRPIVKPNKPLNLWLKEVKRTLRGARKDWPTFIHGGVRKRSYVSFARPHTNKKTVITLDIKDCFGSINQKQVTQSLVKKIGLSEDLAKQLAAKLCIDGNIPQGFATSSFLTNLYLNDVLLMIKRRLVKEQVEMTIYVDDIVVSGNHVDSADVINIVCVELSRAKLAVKKAKIKVMHSHTRQVIVGLVVNKGVALTKEKSKELFSRLASKEMSQASLDGWLANLNMIDKSLMRKLAAYAKKKGYRSSQRRKG